MGAKGYILLFYSLMHNVHLGTKVVDRWNGHRQSILLLNVLVNGLMRQVPIAFNIDTKMRRNIYAYMYATFIVYVSFILLKPR